MTDRDALIQELISAKNTLDFIKKKRSATQDIRKEALEFMEKADKVIRRAEKGEIVLTNEQIQKIKNNLIRIREFLQD